MPPPSFLKLVFCAIQMPRLFSIVKGNSEPIREKICVNIKIPVSKVKQNLRRKALLAYDNIVAQSSAFLGLVKYSFVFYDVITVHA